MNNKDDQRAQICQVAIVVLSNSVITHSFGGSSVTMLGDMLWMRPQAADFTERRDESGSFIVQEFRAVLTDTERDMLRRYSSWMTGDCAVVIKYTNGESIVVGTIQSPVELSIESGGSPRTTAITFKRNSPEWAKPLAPRIPGTVIPGF